MKKTIGILTLALLGACTSSVENTTNDATNNEQMEKETQTLKEILDEKKEGFNAKADSTKKRVYAEGIQAVVDAKIIESALQVGDKAPNFTLRNATGDDVSLYDELNRGPVILMWYRGGWCPYCNLTLKAMQDMLPEYEAAGAQLIALTPETPDKSISTTEKNELAFEVLTDSDSKVAKEYGVLFELTPEVKEYYEKGFGLSEYNGNDKGELPLAATYVIGKDGVVTYAFLDADYRNRAEPSEILAHLQKSK